MGIKKFGEQLLVVRLVLEAGEIPGLLRRHAKNYPGALELEERGRNLIASDFEPDGAVAFVRDVCKWGGGDRHIGRVRDNNAPEEVSRALREGVQLARDGNVGEGVERIKRLHNLGQSFASKQLRFLEPGRAVILDSVIRTGLGYAESARGYSEFLSDCQELLTHVQASGQLDSKQSMLLRVCDIEAAVFAKLQGY